MKPTKLLSPCTALPFGNEPSVSLTGEADVPDGSVDYFPYAWGPLVHYDEQSMEPRSMPCAAALGCGCRGGSPGPCPDNRPTQTAEAEYPIIQE